MFYTVVESSAYCGHCRRQVMTRQQQPSLLFHFLLSLFCCWPWVVVWLVLAFLSFFESYRCTRCGSALATDRKLLVGLLLPILVAVGLIIAVFVLWARVSS